MPDSRSQWVMESALSDCWSSIHRLHWSASDVERVAVGFKVLTNKLLRSTIAPQIAIGCPFCSMHWNWYCLVTMVLGSLQTVKLEIVLWELHWNSTTTETKEESDVFIWSPAASHTMAKFLILTGMVEKAWPPGGIMARATSPSLENSVVLPRSLIVIRGHDCDCASTNLDIKANNKMKDCFTVWSIFSCIVLILNLSSFWHSLGRCTLCVSSPDPMHSLSYWNSRLNSACALNFYVSWHDV